MKRIFSKKIFFSFLFLIAYTNSFAQTVTISGIITDKKNGEPLINATVFNKTNNSGCTTNNFGYYLLYGNLNDTIVVRYSYTGYEEIQQTFFLKHDTIIDIYLNTNIQLNEVVITAKQELNKTDGSVIQIPLEQIKLLPSLAGEPDVLKAYQLMPGIKAGKEGNSSLYVRGGSPDENLIILDDIPLYYINHLGGFVSIFDANAINDIKLIKGGFPARYGGRLSSVIDIRMKDGNDSDLEGEVSAGIIATKLSINGPVKKGTSSYMLSFRRCNLDLFSRLFTTMQSGGLYSAGYTFYDLNFKFAQKLNAKNKLYIALYSGRDKIFINQNYTPSLNSNISYKYDNDNTWGNNLLSIKLNSVVNTKFFINTTLAVSRFDYQTNISYKNIDTQTKDVLQSANINFTSGISDLTGKIDADYFLSSKHTLRSGVNVIYHIFTPGINAYSNTYSDNIDTTFGSENISGVESYIYAEDEWTINKFLAANIGLHFSNYVVDDNFSSLQPRIIVNYNLNKSASLKASFTVMQQNLHLLSNSGVGLPSDLWVPATSIAKPEKSNQYTMGYAYLFSELSSRLTIETYYKQITNLIEFKSGASFFGSGADWQQQVVTGGKGNVYGIEFLFQKQEGRLTGWVGYSLSKNTRQFNELNNGEPYPYKYDSRHDISVVATYKIKKNIIISSDWVYSGGNAITLGYTQYPVINETYIQAPNPFVTTFDNAYIYPSKNNYRLPAYNRLDVAINFIKQKPKGERTWSFSIYNVYNRLNPYFVYFNYDKQGEKHLYQFTLFPVIPSFNYSFKFN